MDEGKSMSGDKVETDIVGKISGLDLDRKFDNSTGEALFNQTLRDLLRSNARINKRNIQSFSTTRTSSDGKSHKELTAKGLEVFLGQLTNAQSEVKAFISLFGNQDGFLFIGDFCLAHIWAAQDGKYLLKSNAEASVRSCKFVANKNGSVDVIEKTIISHVYDKATLEKIVPSDSDKILTLETKLNISFKAGQGVVLTLKDCRVKRHSKLAAELLQEKQYSSLIALILEKLTRFMNSIMTNKSSPSSSFTKMQEFLEAKKNIKNSFANSAKANERNPWSALPEHYAKLYAIRSTDSTKKSSPYTTVAKRQYI